MYLQVFRYFGTIGFYLLFMTIYIPVGYATDETGINSVKELVGQIESGKAYSSSPDQLKQKISQAKKELDAHIKSHPDQIEALILSVRLSIIEELATPTVFSKGKEVPDSKEKFISQHQKLDQVLKLQPDSAEAHYWKARLYGIRPPTIGESGRLEKKPIDLKKAIQFARKAVQLDPKNIGYREALALYLVNDQQRKEALEVMSTGVTEQNPIYILLKDTDSFPLPEGAIFLKADSESFGDMQMSRGRITNYPLLRVQVFIVPMAASKIEAFYQQYWPKFKFFNQRPGLFAQFMIFEEDGLRPTASMSEVKKWKSLPNAIALSVNELLKPTEEQRKMSPAGQTLPTSLGEVFSYVFYVNYRSIN
ncbi:MAG: tetratricopeptide repeat protein [Thiohalomonadales bacterium]